MDKRLCLTILYDGVSIERLLFESDVLATRNYLGFIDETN